MTILYIIPLLQKKSSEKSQKLSKLYIFAILYNLSKYNLDIMSKPQNDAQNHKMTLGTIKVERNFVLLINTATKHKSFAQAFLKGLRIPKAEPWSPSADGETPLLP